MERDMDLIRRIVMAVRESQKVVSGLEGVPREQFAEHAQLLVEAGLVNANVLDGHKKPSGPASIYRLTWAGHNFADSINEDKLWQKAKDNIMKPAASWTFGILLEYLKVEISRKISVIDPFR